MKRRTSEHPDPVDVHVGGRVRLRRTLLGLSQEKLGNALSLTFQQIQKYERGANRIGSSRLYQLSRILEVPVSFFFDDMPEAVSSARVGVSEGQQIEYEHNQLAKRETLELVRAYYRIVDPNVRKRIFELALQKRSFRR
jgi:transcriptional regulator with XRE-family HTH domain